MEKTWTLKADSIKKIVRFYFFPDPTPFPLWEVINSLVKCYLVLFQSCKNHNSVQKVVTTVFFFILSLYGTSIHRKYSIFELFVL